ncbi:unnamed protein product [Ceutorhynchus assimilis]|uniref:Uncharacterized protein n=1 Tax=Ceutorhynchus assimilis TaxID=467358 RepID=A0A9N9QJH5_9CUCU|nr:unnamed protein product [Ceutorhynchus assimilis]
MWIFLLTLTLFVNGYYGENFGFCNFKNPNPNKCLLSSIQSAVKMLRPGMPQYGMKPLDPLHTDKLTFGSGNGPVQLTQYYDNITVTGLSDSILNKAHYDEADDIVTILFSATCPLATQIAHYHAKGQISTLPVFGDGEAILKLVNLQLLLEFKCKKVQKSGKTHLKINSLFLNMVPEKVTMYFGNLFDGNKLLGDNINKVLNDEWQAMWTDVKSEVEKGYGKIFRDYAQVFFDKVPSDQIFIKN